MELKMNLGNDDNAKQKEADKQARLKLAKEKKESAKFVPTWEQVWYGYTKPDGTVKNGILQTKLTDLDKGRLMEVKMAVESGEIGTFKDSLKGFSKSHALNLYGLLKESRKEAIIKEMVEHTPENYHCILTEPQLEELTKLLEGEVIIGLDTETTGLDYNADVIVGISMTLPKADYHCYIPIRHNVPEVQLPAELVFKALKPFIESRDLLKILHNAKFDYHMLQNDGITLNAIKMDTMIAMHILNENEMSYALKNLATKYGKHFGFEDKSSTYEDLFGKGGFQNTPLDIGTVYACKDTHLCYEFYVWIDQCLKDRPELFNAYYNIEAPSLEVCIEMEKNGFAVDLTYAKEYALTLKEHILKMEQELQNVFGDININSNQQLAVVLYETMGLEDISKKKSVDAKTLKFLSDECEPLKLLLEYRGLCKLLSTYVEPLPARLWNRDGRLHGQFKQCSTATGRLASSEPNLQNFPLLARKMIVAPEGKLIMGSDYSQIEPRYLAHISKDDSMRYPYLNGIDLYSTLASKVFKVDISLCGDGTKYRKMMKVGLLAVMYGTSTYTLSTQLGITMDEAEQFIIDFYEAYPDVKAFIEAVQDEANTQEFVVILGGRKRRFVGHRAIAVRFKAVVKKIEDVTKKKMSEIKNILKEKGISRELKSAYWEVAKLYGRVMRQSINAVIQGSSAVIMKLGTLAVYNHIKDKEGWKLLASIHDEILVEFPESATEEEVQKVADLMVGAVTLDIPMRSDIEVMVRWGEGIPLKEWVARGMGRQAFGKDGI